MRQVILVVAVVLASLGSAHAYPQFQLSRDQTCTGCHISPAGGGLLTENGLNTAESISQLGHAPEALYGAWTPPDWLAIGGDFRVLGGVFMNPFLSAAAFPMQGDLYAEAKASNFTFHVTGGIRPAQEGNEAATLFWSREHYVMFKQNPDETTGFYARVGRFLPVFGLRLAEHPAYVRRFGGIPLFAETYGASVSYVQPGYEVHATGFIRDRLIDPVLHDSGGALYAEARVVENAAVAVEGMATASKDDRKYRAGLIGKYYVAPAELLLQTEVLATTLQLNDDTKVQQLTAYLLASRFLTDWLLVDLGLGVYDADLKLKLDDREAVDLNVHWFVDSHLELVLHGRFESLGLGSGGAGGGYGLLQAHFRL